MAKYLIAALSLISIFVVTLNNTYPSKMQYFSSSVGNTRELSNLSGCRIDIIFDVDTDHETKQEVVSFPSAEHCYVAHLCKNNKDAKRLIVGGDLSSFDTGMRIVYPNICSEALERKTNYWSKNNMIGIIAKMYGKMIERKTLNKTEEDELWLKILTAKYIQNSHHRNKLLSTGDATLVEFDRFAKNETKWGGKIVEGRVIGQNYMGKMMMRVRDSLIN